MAESRRALLRLLARLPGRPSRLPRGGRRSAPGRLAAAVGRIVGHARAARPGVAFFARPGGPGGSIVPALPGTTRATARNGRGPAAFPVMTQASSTRRAAPPLSSFPDPATARQARSTHAIARRPPSTLTWATRTGTTPARAAISASWGRAGARATVVRPWGRTTSAMAMPAVAHDHAASVKTPGLTWGGGTVALAGRMPGRRADGTACSMTVPVARAMAENATRANGWPGPVMRRGVPAHAIAARGQTPFTPFRPPRDRDGGRPPFISPGPMERPRTIPPSAPHGGRDDRPPVMQVTIPVTLDHHAIGQAMARIDTAAARHELRATGTAPDVIRYPQMPGRAVGAA